MVIMIDDNKILANVMCELLGVMGYDVTPAYSGEEGIARARAQKPGVILCDIGMAGMSGYDVARFIRRDAGLKDIYLIAVSGYTSRQDVQRSMDAGFDEHMGKPVDLDVLKATLDRILGRWPGDKGDMRAWI